MKRSFLPDDGFNLSGKGELREHIAARLSVKA